MIHSNAGALPKREPDLSQVVFKDHAGAVQEPRHQGVLPWECVSRPWETAAMQVLEFLGFLRISKIF